MEVMMDLDLTIPYQSIKSNLLEHLGHTQSKSQVADVDFKVWEQPVTTKFFGTHSQKHPTVVKRHIITKRLCEGIVSGSIDTPLFSCVYHGLREKDTQTVDQLVVELEASWESRPFIARIRRLRDKINTRKPWMKRPQEPLTTMETGGFLSKGKDGGDLAGRVWFGSKVVASGNQGANSLTPGFTCHYCKEVGHYKRNCPKLKNKLSSIKSSGEESESLKELCRQEKIEGRPPIGQLFLLVT